MEGSAQEHLSNTDRATRGWGRLATGIYPGAQAMGLRLLPLSFVDEDMEAQFRDDYFQRSLSLIRFSIVMGMFALGAFGHIDILFFPCRTTMRLLFLRYILGWAGFLAVLALTYTPFARRLIQPALASLVVLIGLCVIGMMYVGGRPADGYYVGVILCLVFGYTFLRARFPVAVAGGWILVLVYELAALTVLDLPPNPLVTSSTFVVATNLVGMAIAHSLEYYVRREFFLRRTLADRMHQLHLAQAALVRKEKQALMGQLAGALGHELRNPLGVISNAAYYLASIRKEGSEEIKAETYDAILSEYLDIIASEVRNGTHIIDTLFEFSRPRPPQHQSVPLVDLVETVLADLPPPDGIRVHRQLPPLTVWADAQQIQSALGHVVRNAYQAMPEGGELTIVAHLHAADGVQGTPQNGHIEITIRDTGEGIDPKHMDRIFEPLFTTKARGIGLGLPLARNLIEANSGTIRVGGAATEPGSLFVIMLPATATIE